MKFIVVTNRRSIVAHPEYINSNNRIINDIGLVELPEDAPIYNSYVGIVALPQGSEVTRNLENVQSTVSGFGLDL